MEYGSEHRKVLERSIEEMTGVKIIEVLGALRLLSGGTLNHSALDNLNLTTAADINGTAGWNLKGPVGNARVSLAKVLQLGEAQDDGTVWVHSESLNVLQVLVDRRCVIGQYSGKSHHANYVGAVGSTGGYRQTSGRCRYAKYFTYHSGCSINHRKMIRGHSKFSEMPRDISLRR